MHNGPLLFNVYTGAVVEKWHTIVADTPKIGVTISQHRGDKLFNAHLATLCRVKVTECQFADDSLLWTKTYAGGGSRDLLTFQDVAKAHVVLL